MQDRNQDATCYVGNLDENVTDAIVWELFLQCGPVSSVHLPKDRVSMSHQGFGFVEFFTEADADYAIKIMNQVKLYGKPIRVNKASSDKKQIEVGATLFVGNLDPGVDEKVLYDTFSAFGVLTQTPKVARDESGLSRGFGFVSYDNFESSDAAKATMNKQFLMNKEINVDYALKKDGHGERHGDEAERLLAAQSKKNLPPTQPATPVFAQPPPPPVGVPVYQPPIGGMYGQPPPPPGMGYPPPPPPPQGFGSFPPGPPPGFARPPPPPSFQQYG